MKFRVTMKCPDALDDAIRDAVGAVGFDGLSEDEAELVRESRSEAARKLCSRWFEYGEYLTVEVDTEAGTCVVMEA